MSSMRLSSLLNHLESDSEEEDTFTYEWGRSGPRYDETLKERWVDEGASAYNEQTKYHLKRL